MDRTDDSDDVAPDRPSDLPIVLRRLALEPAFAAAVVADPLTALYGFSLTADDLAALAVWLERREPGCGVRALFDTTDP